MNRLLQKLFVKTYETLNPHLAEEAKNGYRSVRYDMDEDCQKNEEHSKQKNKKNKNK